MDTPEARVAEFLRQWALMRDKSDDIYGVHADPNGKMAQLTASDLHAVLERSFKMATVVLALTEPGTEQEVNG